MLERRARLVGRLARARERRHEHLKLRCRVLRLGAHPSRMLLGRARRIERLLLEHLELGERRGGVHLRAQGGLGGARRRRRRRHPPKLRLPVSSTQLICRRASLCRREIEGSALE